MDRNGSFVSLLRFCSNSYDDNSTASTRYFDMSNSSLIEGSSEGRDFGPYSGLDGMKFRRSTSRGPSCVLRQDQSGANTKQGPTVSVKPRRPFPPLRDLEICPMPTMRYHVSRPRWSAEARHFPAPRTRTPTFEFPNLRFPILKSHHASPANLIAGKCDLVLLSQPQRMGLVAAIGIRPSCNVCHVCHGSDAGISSTLAMCAARASTHAQARKWMAQRHCDMAISSLCYRCT